jgi:polysaccharide biosynthesis protein PslH
MGNILFLVHRMPYPPNKGDKVRSYHLLRHLQRHHRVFLGTFIDTHEDDEHLPALRAICPDLHVERIRPRWNKLLSLVGLLRREPLTMSFYRSAGMRHWVRKVSADHTMQASLVFTSPMAQYARKVLRTTPMVADFVDLDSEKWSQYAPAHRWPYSWLYAREARRLLQAEAAIAKEATASLFVTPGEVRLFHERTGHSHVQAIAIGNGVDTEHFAPDPGRGSPFSEGELPIVFVGAMDYWPNVDAVKWFASAVMPRVVEQWPRARFHVVGRNPTKEVQALASACVAVSGTVTDVRPYLQHARVVVAPLRVARGLQNKILEAMAMARPVIAAPDCVAAIGASEHVGLFQAGDVPSYLRQLQRLLDDPAQSRRLGDAARAHMRQHFRWEDRLAALDELLLNLREPNG